MNKKKILIVEDDNDISMVEEVYLEASGHEVCIVDNGENAISRIATEKFDLIILDVLLPDKNGYDVCKEVRSKVDIPIIMVTAMSEPIDKIRGLGLGADDYISKPFDPAELTARVNANLRQYERLVGSNSKNDNIDEIKVKDIRILVNSWKVYKGENEVKLANKEFELLKFLAINHDIVFSKEQLFEKIWGYDYIGDSATVMVHINRIREKIEDDAKQPKIIETVWGAGYRLNT